LHIVDVGANIGLYSIIACKKLDGCGKIWAFEPSSQNYERFLLNLSLNKCDDLVTPVNMGLGNKDDEKIFLRRDRGCGDAEKYILPDNKSPIGGSPIIREKLEEEVIILTTLDSFMNKINNPKVDLIKMDIEGFEYFAFQGGRKILELNPDIVLLFECNELGTQRAGYTPQNIFDILNEYGLNCFYWNSEQQMFKKDKVSLLKAGNLWACNTVEQLPKFVS
jgi:FkbM family methyltransferase